MGKAKGGKVKKMEKIREIEKDKEPVERRS